MDAIVQLKLLCSDRDLLKSTSGHALSTGVARNDWAGAVAPLRGRIDAIPALRTASSKGA